MQLSPEMILELEKDLSELPLNETLRRPEWFRLKVGQWLKDGYDVKEVHRICGIPVKTLTCWRLHVIRQNFKKIPLKKAPSESKVRIYFDANLWLEVDRCDLTKDLIHFVRSTR